MKTWRTILHCFNKTTVLRLIKAHIPVNCIILDLLFFKFFSMRERIR